MNNNKNDRLNTVMILIGVFGVVFWVWLIGSAVMDVSASKCSKSGCSNYKSSGAYCYVHTPKSSSKSTTTKSYSGTSNSYSSNSNTYKSTSSGYKYSDPYDVKSYKSADDFADDWADEFDDGDWGDAWDDATEYWEDNY